MKKEKQAPTKTVRVEILVPEKGPRPSKYRSAMWNYDDEDARYRPAEYVPARIDNVPEEIAAEDVRAGLQSMIDRGRGYALPLDWAILARDLAAGGR